jgi:hypothetical protein
VVDQIEHAGRGLGLEPTGPAARRADVLERRLDAAARAQQDRQDGGVHAPVVAETARQFARRRRDLRVIGRRLLCA